MRGETEVVSVGHSFLEGPRWIDGRLIASDMYSREVVTWDESGEPSRLCAVPHSPSGLGRMPDGDLLIVSMEDRKVLRLGPEGPLALHADLGALAPWHLNDMVVDAEGRAYVGNLGWDDEHEDRIRSTVLIRVDPDGAATVVADDLVNPNGMAITPDGRTLLVNETFAARTTAFDIGPNRSLGGRRTWAAYWPGEFETVRHALASGAILPDGIALDRDGAAWIGDCHGSAAVRVAEGATILDRVWTGLHATFAVALGGTERRQLFLCTAPPYRHGGLTLGQSAMCRADIEIPGAGSP